MSTRGCVARLTGKPGRKNRFSGCYLHWDNYPSGTGSTLFQIRNGHFKGDTAAMLKVLIDNHKNGWSTINDADWNLPPAPETDSGDRPCKICGKPSWMHYHQDYAESNQRWIDAGRPEAPPRMGDSYAVGDHSFEQVEVPHGPICFPPSKDAGWVNERNASGMGCEYAYAFSEDGKTMFVLSSYSEMSNGDIAKSIGMFGMGDKKAKWMVIGEIDLDGIEPGEEQWKHIPIIQPRKEDVDKALAQKISQAIAEEETKQVKEEEDKNFAKSELSELIG